LQLLAQDYGYKELTKVPPSALRATSLQSLKLNNNSLQFLPDSICVLTSLRLLDLSNNRLDHLPVAMESFEKLQELNLRGNKFKNTAPEFKQVEEKSIPMRLADGMTSLETLILAENGFIWIPPAVLEMPIKRLDLSHNQLRYLPEFLETAKITTSLELLHVGDNEIRDLDSQSVSRLLHTRELIVESNLLVRLPDTVGDLHESLELLWAGQNRLEEIPFQIGQLTRLRSLRLEKNKLHTIPVEIANCTLLEDLNLFNNTFLYQPPEEVVVRGCRHVVAYLQRMKEVANLKAAAGDGLDGTTFSAQEDDDDIGLEKEFAHKPANVQKAQDAEGEPYLMPGSVTRPKNPVMYLHQECDLLEVYTELDQVFVNIYVISEKKVLTRIPEHMIQ